jgi:uncharacterized protein (TIGR04141 family)
MDQKQKTGNKSNKQKLEKLSIYLAKNRDAADVDLVRIEKARIPLELSISNGQATLYVKKELPPHLPSWTKFLTANQNLPEDIFGYSSNIGALLIVRLSRYVFVLTFGSGYHLLKNFSIERDFGLRVTLNSVDPDKLRSLDKANYDHKALNSRTQSARDVDIFELEIDSEMDIVYAVTGASKVAIFGSHVTGRDALTINSEIDLNQLSELLNESMLRYSMALPDKFSWIDNVGRVKDIDLIAVLEMELNDALASPPDESNFWLGEPEIVDWETQIGYSFDLHQKTPRHVLLQLDSLSNYLLEKNSSINVESLKQQTIHINDSNYQSFKQWTAYQCLYAEIKIGSEQYILRNGIWYLVDTDFIKKIDLYLSTIDSYPVELPVYSHDREEEYNLHVSETDNTFDLLDKKNISIGGPYDKIEFCDLIKDGRDLIHVKYYRSSSTLSHLFAQGCVAALTFIRDSEFRKKLNGKLPTSIKLIDFYARPKPEMYRIVFAIATKKKLPIELPFFSKVTLKNSIQTLRSLNYQVELATIDIDPLLFLKKKGKPSKEKKI